MLDPQGRRHCPLLPRVPAGRCVAGPSQHDQQEGAGHGRHKAAGAQHLAGDRADGGLAASLHRWLWRPRERHGIGRWLAERLTFHASSTTTKLTAIETGLRKLLPWSPGRAVVPSDSNGTAASTPPRRRHPTARPLRRVAHPAAPGSRVGNRLPVSPLKLWDPGNDKADRVAGLVHFQPGFPCLHGQPSCACLPASATGPLGAPSPAPYGQRQLAVGPLVLHPDRNTACPKCGDERSAGQRTLPPEVRTVLRARSGGAGTKIR